jgi:hypothetical protein
MTDPARPRRLAHAEDHFRSAADALADDPDCTDLSDAARRTADLLHRLWVDAIRNDLDHLDPAA